MFVHVVLEGTLPLLVHSQRAMNYREPKAQELQRLNSKRGKTLEDRDQISDLEFELALYYDEGLGPYLPAFNLKRALQDGGKAMKLGKHVQEAVRTLPGADKVPLIYDGPRSVAALLKDARFRDVRTVGISGRTVERTRPIFTTWKLAANFILDEDRMDLQALGNCADRAASYIGLGDFRPEYGLFRAHVTEADVDTNPLGA